MSSRRTERLVRDAVSHAIIAVRAALARSPLIIRVLAPQRNLNLNINYSVKFTCGIIVVGSSM